MHEIEKKANKQHTDIRYRCARLWNYSTIYCLSVLAQGYFGCYSSFPAEN